MHKQERLVLRTQSYKNGQTGRQGIHCWLTISDGDTTLPMDTAGDPTALDNGKRLVDCWNALAGIDDPAAFVAKVREIVNYKRYATHMPSSACDWADRVKPLLVELAALLPPETP